MPSEQWVALIVTASLAVISIAISLYQSGQSRAAALSAEKIRADISAMTINMLDRIDAKLDDYVRQQAMKDYIESHSKEHIRIEQEMTRLRDWKEGADTELRRITARLRLDEPETRK